MKLLNFQLSQPFISIHLLGLDFTWDLHNAGTFHGLKLNASDNTLVMSWSVEGNPAPKYSECDLVFTGLKLLIISPRDEELPNSEDSCVSGISKVIPGTADKPDSRMRMRREWAASDPFHLLFQFQSGRDIEIDAETVGLVGIEHGSAGQFGQ